MSGSTWLFDGCLIAMLWEMKGGDGSGWWRHGLFSFTVKKKTAPFAWQTGMTRPRANRDS